MTSVGAINPIVESPSQVIQPQLLVALIEAFEQDFALIGRAIIVCVTQVKNLWCCGDQDSIAPSKDARGEVKLVSEQMAFFIASVAIQIFQNSNASTRFALAVHP